MTQYRLNINSRVLTNGKLILQRTIPQIKKIAVSNVIIPNSWYLVDADNNTIDFEDAVPNSYTCNLTPGNYNANQLAAEIAIQMTSALATFTCTYSSITSHFTITNTVPTNFVILTTCSAYSLLGYPTSVLAASTESTLSYDLLRYNEIYIQSINLCQGIHSLYINSITNNNIFYSVPISTTQLGVIIDEPTDVNVFYRKNIDLNEIDLRLIVWDKILDDFKALNLNGLDWSITLDILAEDR